MRPIKFRGKDLSGKWREGALVIFPQNNRVTIYDAKAFSYTRIDPETVGQFTGLLDKNGKEIYEGDIISYTILSRPVNYVCEFNKGAWRMVDVENGYDQLLYMFHKKCTIIGNIHDNPELIK